ncbi:MAG: ribonuclease H-like domain-containing protein [Candidatus Liptonbacteria bacterium]|nr:ribonuclease H-like domain-containing protein [Candidatus Liptonbacteria bacterium]
MIPDTVVLDIETKNSFADVGGRDRIDRLEVSLVGVYSYNEGRYLAFKDTELANLETFLKNAGLIIGFSINRFDIPVLAKHFKFDLWKINRLDLLDEIETSAGQRIGLDLLAQANLGVGKTNHGLEAIKFYKEGRWKELEEYCLNDVKITKDLYELAKSRGHLIVPERNTGNRLEVKLAFSEFIFPQTLF